jgi:phage tail protein X
VRNALHTYHIWRKLLSQSATITGVLAAIEGFLLAVRDCCLHQGLEAKLPDFVAQELAKQAGLASSTRQP